MQLRWIMVVMSVLVPSAEPSPLTTGDVALALAEGNLQSSVQVLRLKHAVLQLAAVLSSRGAVQPASNSFAGVEIESSVFVLLQFVLRLHLDLVVEALIVKAVVLLF